MRALSRPVLFSTLSVFVLVSAGLTAWLLAAEPSLEAMKQTVRKRFPSVPQMTTAELAAWLRDPKRPPPVLLDTRSEAEFTVSHLRGAIRIDPDAKAAAITPLLPAGRPVVAYCSVGYRSSAVAERLAKAGVTRVFNLEGSIFEWANEGRPLEADGQPAVQVHPYNRRYGALLDPAKRARP